MAGSADTVEDLLPRVVAGDLDAFGELYDALAPSVYGLAYRIVRDPGIAEDVTQEVFLDVWRHAVRFDATAGRVKSWVLTIAHRRAVDAVRSREAARRREDRAAGKEPVVAPAVDGGVLAAAERAGVRRCLESLTPLQRESVMLAYYRGHTYPQVAALLQRPLSTVKTRMRDGLARLRACLEANDV